MFKQTVLATQSHLVEQPVPARALCSSMLWAIGEIGATVLLWQWGSEHGAFSVGLGGTSLTEWGVQAREYTENIAGAVLAASVLFYATAYWPFRQLCATRQTAALSRPSLAGTWLAWLKLLWVGWLLVDAWVVLGLLISLGDDGMTWVN